MNSDSRSPPKASIVSFTLIYLVMPGWLMGGNINYLLVASILSLLVINVYMQVYMNCTNHKGAALGSLVGIMFGILYTTILSSDDHMKKMLYHMDGENSAQKCKLHGQKYKCTTL